MKVTTDMTTLYGTSNCDRCRKANNWFNENRITYDFFDFRKNELTQTKIETWIDSIGLDKLINRRGTTWRNLPDELRDKICLLYTSPSPRDVEESRMPSSA